MNRQTLSKAQSDDLPITRWFVWLLIGVVLTLIYPYFSGTDDRYYSPTIGTYQEVDGVLQPTAAKIWVDGRTGDKLNANIWLYVILAGIVIEYIGRLISRAIRSRSESLTTPAPKAP